MEPAGAPDATGENVYIELSRASEVASETPAMVKLANERVPTFGFDKSDWEARKTGGAGDSDKDLQFNDNNKVYRRGVDGSPSGEITDAKIENFVPSEQSA